MLVSIIIPVYNEEKIIQSQLIKLKALAGNKEIIVVDGGSTDQTKKLAAKLADSIIQSPKGRWQQMNRGAKIAKGEILLFVHADIVLPGNALLKLHNLDHSIIAGGWRLGFKEKNFWLQFLGLVNMLRVHLFKTLYGDHAIFVRKEAFWKAGGFAPLPIMEDFDFSKRIKQYGKVVVFHEKVFASGRRFITKGFFSTLWLMIQVRISYLFQLPLKSYIKYYDESR